MGTFGEMNLQSLKTSINLTEIVEAAGVELKRQGNRHMGLCPFHADETPSFYVFPDGHFKCFGCGEYGDVIDFIEKLHGCNFKEALSILGIKPEGLTPQKRRQIERLKRQRELVKIFRQWEIEAADEAAMLCRCARKVLGNIRTEADHEKYGNLYHGLESWQYHLDILTANDDEAKLGLHNAKYYN